MAFRFDSKQPEPINVIGREGESFTLNHRRLTGHQRLAVHEALTAGICSIEAGGVRGQGMSELGLDSAVDILWGNVLGWAGVQDAAGNDLAFSYTDEDGRDANRLDEVMGAVPLKEVLRAVFVQMSLNGIHVPASLRSLFIRVLGDAAFEASLEEELAGFLPEPAKTDGTCSAGSASSETSTPPSD